MIDHHRSDRAVVVGSSTHNERIERLWRDVFRCVGTVLYETFKHLEEEKLDPLNEIDIYCPTQFSYFVSMLLWMHLWSCGIITP